MTNEDWLGTQNTAQGSKSSEKKITSPLIKGKFPTIAKGQSHRTTHVVIDSTQRKLTSQSYEKTGRKQVLGLVFGVMAAVLTVVVIVGVFLGYRYYMANIEGDWTSQTFSQQMKESIADSTKNKGEFSNSLPKGEELITDIKTIMSVSDEKAQLTVSFVYNRQALYQTYTARVSELKKQYDNDFSSLFDTYSLSEKEYFKQFDDTVMKELPDSYQYDTRTGRVTTVAFSGNVNRWDRTITVSKAGDTESFKQGDVLDYNPMGSNFIIESHSDYGNITFTKNKQ